MYRKRIVAQDEETVTIQKETFYEMTLKIQHLEQEEDDHEFLKFEFEKQKERINSLEDQLEEEKKKSEETILFANQLLIYNDNLRNDLKKSQEDDLMSRITKKLSNEDIGFQYNWQKRFKEILAELDIHP